MCVCLQKPHFISCFHVKRFHDPRSLWPPLILAHSFSYCLFTDLLMTAQWGSICFLCDMNWTGRCGQRGHSLRLQFKREGAKLTPTFHFVLQSQTLSLSTGWGVLLPGGFLSLSLFCSTHHWLAACHPDHSQEPSPHNHSSCWIIQSKQWPTFEVGNML